MAVTVFKEKKNLNKKQTTSSIVAVTQWEMIG